MSWNVLRLGALPFPNIVPDVDPRDSKVPLEVWLVGAVPRDRRHRRRHPDRRRAVALGRGEEFWGIFGCPKSALEVPEIGVSDATGGKRATLLQHRRLSKARREKKNQRTTASTKLASRAPRHRRPHNSAASAMPALPKMDRRPTAARCRMAPEGSPMITPGEHR